MEKHKMEEELILELLTFDELVDLARAAHQDEGDESGAYWDVVWVLAANSEPETREGALQLTQGDAFERAFAATVLVRLALRRYLQGAAMPEIVDVLLAMLETETEADVLRALVSSLSGHQEIDERIPPVVKGFFNHPDVNLRWALAVGLPSYETPEALEMLITLTADADTDIRHWATSNLETEVSLDSPEIRAALLARLEDANPDTRVEALYALAKRKDARVVPAILREFETSNPSELFESLAALPGYGLALALQKMADDSEYEGDKAELQAAIEKCEAFSRQFAEGER